MFKFPVYGFSLFLCLNCLSPWLCLIVLFKIISIHQQIFVIKMKESKNTSFQSYLGLATFFPTSFSVIMIFIWDIVRLICYSLFSILGSAHIRVDIDCLFIGRAGM